MFFTVASLVTDAGHETYLARVGSKPVLTKILPRVGNQTQLCWALYSKGVFGERKAIVILEHFKLMVRIRRKEKLRTVRSDAWTRSKQPSTHHPKAIILLINMD